MPVEELALNLKASWKPNYIRAEWKNVIFAEEYQICWDQEANAGLDNACKPPHYAFVPRPSTDTVVFDIDAPCGGATYHIKVRSIYERLPPLVAGNDDILHAGPWHHTYLNTGSCPVASTPVLRPEHVASNRCVVDMNVAEVLAVPCGTLRYHPVIMRNTFIVEDQGNGNFRLKSAVSGKCLSGNAQENGVASLAECTDPSALTLFHILAGGPLRLATSAKKCLFVDASSQSIYAPVYNRDCAVDPSGLDFSSQGPVITLPFTANTISVSDIQMTFRHVQSGMCIKPDGPGLLKSGICDTSTGAFMFDDGSHILGVDYVEGEKIRLRDLEGGQCIGSNHQNGAPIMMTDCTSTLSIYVLDSASGETVRMRNDLTGRCLYVDGGIVGAWTCWDDPNMRFLAKARERSDGGS